MTRQQLEAKLLFWSTNRKLRVISVQALTEENMITQKENLTYNLTVKLA